MSLRPGLAVDLGPPRETPSRCHHLHGHRHIRRTKLTRAAVDRRFVELIADECRSSPPAPAMRRSGWRTPVKGFEPHIIGLLAYPGGGLPSVWLDR